MSPNKDRLHVLVLPEDDANRQIANGFLLEVEGSRLRQVQILEEAGGWRRVLDKFEADHVREMERCASRSMVLIIDCDGRANRLTDSQRVVPEHLRHRVFIVGALTTPEDLRNALGLTFEEIGKGLADDCREDTSNIWGHALLQQNLEEARRMKDMLRALLFERGGAGPTRRDQTP